MPRIAAVQINVDDMDKAVDFYVGLLGFSVESMQHYPQIVKLKASAFSLLLFNVNRPCRLAYPDVAMTLVNIETDDLRSDLERLRRLGVELLHDRPMPCPVGVYAAIRDPAGNVLELLEYGETHARAGEEDLDRPQSPTIATS